MPTGAYKRYQRSGRIMTSEQSFALGMQYTDVPLPEGASKVLVNYDIKDSGAALIPRGGFRRISDTLRTVGMGTNLQRLHHTAQTAITSPTLEDEMHRYIMTAEYNPETAYFAYAKMRVMMEDSIQNGIPNMMPAVMETDDADVEYRILAQVPSEPNRIHKITYAGLPKVPVHAVLNNKTYFPAVGVYADNDTISGIAKLTTRREALDADYIARLELITPRDITPTEAVNYGYNMLSRTPYTFEDRISASVGAGYIILDGILPYADDSCSQVLFGARVGQWITFRLYAQFHDNADTFKFRWELRDLNSDDITVYEDPGDTSALTYHYDSTASGAIDNLGLNYIRLRVQPPYKQFSVTVTAYSTTDLTEPIQVMTLASYSLSTDNKTNRIEVKTYDLSTTGGMCVWQQHLVLWAPRSGKNIMFVSEVNDASYFPYPNNANVFDENIVACIPYLSDLLVFTETKLHRLTWSADGLSYTAKVIQDKLMLSEQDKASIQVVKNMVFFKNGNYYYMVVPGTDKTTADLQLAPISKPITNLLDNFQQEVSNFVLTMYNPQRLGNPGVDCEYALRLQDYYNYLDNSAVRNVYKFELVSAHTETGAVTQVLADLALMLNYDTMLRTWTCYVVESNTGRMLPYRQTVTDTTTFINLINAPTTYFDEAEQPVSGYTAQLEFVKIDTLNPSDDFVLDRGLLSEGRRFKNWQFIDTGHRAQQSDYKKRYREIQYKLNNLSQYTLEFGVEFLLDDELRKSLFDYVVDQINEDPTDPNYGWTFITREYADPLLSPGATLLEADEEVDYDKPYPAAVLTSGDVLYSNRWVLGYSKLSKVTMSKISLEVSGKGYSPQMKFLSFNERRYEYLGHNWVYRTMNAR